MKRRTTQVNGTTRVIGSSPRSRWSLTVVVVAISLVASCGPRERRAEKIYREAARAVEAGDFEAAVDKLDVILRDHPDTAVASRAREEIVVYQGLAHAVAAYPGRRTYDAIVQIARALDRHRSERGVWPDRLEDLAPDRMLAIPVDGWERAYVYERTAKGYRLSSFGSDGVSGGEGDAGDIVVENGTFIRGRAR